MLEGKKLKSHSHKVPEFFVRYRRTYGLKNDVQKSTEQEVKWKTRTEIQPTKIILVHPKCQIIFDARLIINLRLR